MDAYSAEAKKQARRESTIIHHESVWLEIKHWADYFHTVYMKRKLPCSSRYKKRHKFPLRSPQISGVG